MLLKVLSNESLITAYNQARQLNLQEDFIQLLQETIKQRNLNVQDYPTPTTETQIPKELSVKSPHHGIFSLHNSR